MVLCFAGSFGGGKSGFRRIHAHLQGLLKGLLPQLGEQVADLFFTAVDDLAGHRLVDGIGDFAEHFLHPLPHRLNIRFTRKLRFHRRLLSMGQSLGPTRQLPILTIFRKMRQVNLPHPVLVRESSTWVTSRGETAAFDTGHVSAPRASRRACTVSSLPSSPLITRTPAGPGLGV